MTHFSNLMKSLLVHRRLLAAGAAMASVLAVCSVLAGPGEATTEVYTAATRIAAGTVIGADQVVLTAVPVGLVPAGAVTAQQGLEGLAGKMTTGPVPAGAILTADNFVAAAQAAEGSVIIPLTVPANLLAVLHPGDHVSVFATDPATGVVSRTSGVRVVTIPAPGSSGVFSSGGGNSILVEVSVDIAGRIGAGSGLGVTVAIE